MLSWGKNWRIAWTLIKTVPPRMHESLTARLRKELAEAPFDKQRLRQLLKDEYKSSGLQPAPHHKRDQTSKAIGGLVRNTAKAGRVLNSTSGLQAQDDETY